MNAKKINNKMERIDKNCVPVLIAVGILSLISIPVIIVSAINIHDKKWCRIFQGNSADENTSECTSGFAIAMITIGCMICGFFILLLYFSVRCSFADISYTQSTNSANEPGDN